MTEALAIGMEESRPSQHAPILRLPGEIRNAIYAILLTNTTKISTAYFQRYNINVKLNIYVAILRVCRQFHAEALPLLYALNRFQAHPYLLSGLPYLAEPARPVTSAHHAALIRRFHVCVRLDCDPFWTGVELAKAFDGVEELEVEAWQPSYLMCGTKVLELFSCVRGVGRAKVVGAGMDEGFARWLEGAMESPKGSELPSWKAVEWNEWETGNR